MDFKWLNESEMVQEGNRIEIVAPPKTDFFRGNNTRSEDGSFSEAPANAPFYYTEVEGDFVLRVKVSLDFLDTYDASAIMVMKDLSCWAKACFEATDFDTHAVVSVVTNEISDDANGQNLEGNTVWLQMCRQDNDFALHYSTDGETFYMMRYFYLPLDPVAKVGLVAQSPIGRGGKRIFEDLSIEKKAVKDIRAGK